MPPPGAVGEGAEEQEEGAHEEDPRGGERLQKGGEQIFRCRAAAGRGG
eukprot:CAMPEP_0198202882 /NCGR_PEP_ID=MMETSP1445-20131203/6110_1 /TAXON_ID=36898 /ORGANISM="Pyramimonas sp., Strain CCMP2087" /LENGTH=47 /DNA_ID= /DNA_START= /DNA_END= /DNA_ORIENTATION=